MGGGQLAARGVEKNGMKKTRVRKKVRWQRKRGGKRGSRDGLLGCKKYRSVVTMGGGALSHKKLSRRGPAPPSPW